MNKKPKIDVETAISRSVGSGKKRTQDDGYE